MLSAGLRQWFAQPWAFWLLWLLPLLSGLSLLAWWQRRRALLRLGAGMAFAEAVTRPSWTRHVRRLLQGLGLLLLVLGIAGPQWGRDWDQTAAPGRDIVVVLDLSRSMLAETPSRLDRARRLLHNMADRIQARGGHRLALVVFAGRARIACPLTHDYDHFRDILDNFDGEHMDPELYPQENSPSGTRIGGALKLAVLAHDDRFRGMQDILLVSDGDDPARDEEWRAGARVAHARRIPVFTVGIGDPEQPRPIPYREGMLLEGGKPVLTRLEEKPLEEIATLTGASYLPVRTSDLGLGDVLLERIASGPVREENEDALPLYHQRYLWFLGPAFVLLLLSLVINDSTSRRLAAPVAVG